MKRAILIPVAISAATSALVSAIVMTVSLATIAGAQETTLRAERVVVVDGDANERVVLRTGPGFSASVFLLSPDGGNRVSLTTSRTGLAGAGVNVFDGQGTQIGRLGTFGDNTLGVNLVLTDRQAQNRVRIAVDEDGTPFMEFYDANGNVIWRAP